MGGILSAQGIASSKAAAIRIKVASSPNISSIMASVPPERRGVASAVRATLFNSGSVISIGLVAYIITTAIPYPVVSGIISGGYTSLSIGESIGFVTGVGRAFIVTAIITFFGMLASSLRGPETRIRSNSLLLSRRSLPFSLCVGTLVRRRTGLTN